MIGLTVIANGRMAHSARLLARSLLRAAALGRYRPVAATAEFSTGQLAMLARPAGFGQERTVTG
jgi:hypothetical protein